MGDYTMRKADGSPVAVLDGGEQVPFPVPEIHVDQLVEQAHLVRDGSKYRPQG